jgi:hypothetical protein
MLTWLARLILLTHLTLLSQLTQLTLLTLLPLRPLLTLLTLYQERHQASANPEYESEHNAVATAYPVTFCWQK